MLCLNTFVESDAIMSHFQRIPPPLPSLNESSDFASYPLRRNAQPTMHLGNSCYLASHNHRYAFKGYYFAGVPHHYQVGINCGAIDEASRSLKAIDNSVIIDFRDKNAVIARFRDINEVFI